MKLCSLIKNLPCRVFGNAAVEINGLYHKDTEVKENGLFFCLRGTKVDGENFVRSAIKNGAVVVVCEQEIAGISGVTQVIVKNAREAMSIIACRFYKDPASKLKIIGVTGTNGKTTVSHMLFSIIEAAGKRAAIVGTNGIILKGQKFSTGMTTPDPIVLQKYLSLMVKEKIEYVCMEVSAHALDLCKTGGIKFEIAIFTNLTQDHLDYFKTMERYFLAKQKLFSRKNAKQASVNIDDTYGRRLAESINIPFVTYSNTSEANFRLFAHEKFLTYQKIDINSEAVAKLPLLGDFNVSNALSAASALKALGFSWQQIANGLENMKPVDGRFNSYDVGSRVFIVDYAHTPDGLENILKAAKNIASGGKLIVVFGCGGDRDKHKRGIMGKIASDLSDWVIVSNDNPRFENPKQIASEIVGGIENGNFEICLDRALAIKRAYQKSAEGDVIVVAGKGAEDYIEENGNKIFYSDRLEIEKLRRNL